MINQIAPAHVEHGTERDERTKTDVLLQAPVEDCRAKRAALADETDAPRLRHVRRKRRVKFCAGNHHTQTVRPDDADARLVRLLQNLTFEFDPNRTDFLEAGGNNNDTFHARLAAIFDDAGHGRGRGDDDGEICFLWHGRDAGIRLYAEHGVAFGVNRKDFTGESAFD